MYVDFVKLTNSFVPFKTILLFFNQNILQKLIFFLQNWFIHKKYSQLNACKLLTLRQLLKYHVKVYH